MLKNSWLIFFCIFSLFAGSACKEKSAAVVNTSEKKVPLTATQDSAHRQQYMFDKSPKAELLPAELIPFVYNPYVAFSFEEADLNRDGRKDYILVLIQPYLKDENGEDDLNSVPEETPAPVLIILRQKKNTLKFHSKNVLAFTQDNLQHFIPTGVGIEADTLGNGFHMSSTTQGAGATASYTNVNYHFVLDKKSNKFYLSETSNESGFVSPGAAIDFMNNQESEDSNQVNNSSLSEEDAYETETSSEKLKPGEHWFPEFRFEELDPIE